MAYPIETFGSAPIKIIDGDRGKAYPKQSEFRPSGYCLFLSATNVTKEGFDFGTGQFIDEQKDVQLRKGKLQREDVVLTTRGTLGNVAHYNTNVPFEHVRINSGMVILRCDQSKILPRYLFAYLRSGLFRGQVERMRSGVAQPQLPIRDMKWIEIPLPTPSQQERLVEILSAYDDLIENNRRRIALLEEVARLLYRELFVHFRFPGHEHVKIIDGLPEGWERPYLGDVVTTQYGHTASASDEEVGPKFVRGTDINKRSFIDWATVPYCPEQGLDFNKYALVPGDILVIRMADPGKVAFIEKTIRAVFASYLVRLKVRNPEELPPIFLFMTLMEERYQGFIRSSSGGSTRKSASAKLLTDFHFVKPPKVLLKLFIEQVAPMREMITKLVDQSSGAAQARDLLLPRLMNGEIAV